MSMTTAAIRHRLLRVTAEHWRLAPAAASRQVGGTPAPTPQSVRRAPLAAVPQWPLRFAV